MRTKSRLEKILRGALHAGRYAGLAAVASTLGCVPIPNIISVSADGRYVAFSLNEEGNLVLDDKHGQSIPVLVDLETNSVRTMGDPVLFAAMLSNTSDAMAFSSVEDQKAVTILLSEGERRVIQDAQFPSLSPNGRFLLYSKISEGLYEEKIDLYMTDLQTDSTRLISHQAFLPDFSPDNKHFSYLRQKKPNYHLVISDINGENERVICEVNDATVDKFMIPQWVDNERLAFRTRTPFSGKDDEIFIADLEGEIEQVTNNDFDDAYPQVTRDGRVVYLTNQGNGSLPELVGNVFVSEKRDGEWHSRPLGINAIYFKLAANDRIVYAVPGEGEHTSTNLYIANLNNPSQRTDLKKLIMPHLRGKFPATQPSSSTQPSLTTQ